MASPKQSPLFTPDIIQGTSAWLHMLIQGPRLLHLWLCVPGGGQLPLQDALCPASKQGQGQGTLFLTRRPGMARVASAPTSSARNDHLGPPPRGRGCGKPSPVPREERVLHLQPAQWVLQDSLNTGYGPPNAASHSSGACYQPISCS